MLSFIVPPYWSSRRHVRPCSSTSLGTSRYRTRISCLLDHLPREAYTTLPDIDAVDNLTSDGGTSVCRLIPHLDVERITDAAAVTRAIDHHVRHGFTTFVLSPDETGARDDRVVREYARVAGRGAAAALQVVARVNVTLDERCASRANVQKVVDGLLTRLGTDRLHVLQVVWPDFQDGRFVDFLGEASELRRVGKIGSVGVVNFPTRQLQHLWEQDVRVSCNQVGCSLVDRRALGDMGEWCARKGVRLLAHSSLGGGFFSERFVGMPEPSRRACDSAALMRFAGVIRMWGGWALFQELLFCLQEVAEKHEVSMANVALRWVLQQDGVTAVVVGARPIERDGEMVHHGESNVQAFSFRLDDEDVSRLDAVCSKGNDLLRVLGDCASEGQASGRMSLL